MEGKKVGLTLGKFAPLHKGHQYMIETALEEMDEVIVVIYDCPETTPIPLNIRAQWIREIYPTIQVIEAWDGPTESGYTPEIKEKQEKYILQLLNEKKITDFYSSELYGDHMSKALGATNRLVDCNRILYPVSGTQVRKDSFNNREYVHPVVYRDLITNVVFLGAPSTGKTTLAQRMAQELDTQWMPEYGREYWARHQVNRRLTPSQLVEIGEGHQKREEDLLLEAKEFLFTDTNALTTYMFAMEYHGYVEERLAELARQSASRYDLVFVCGNDIPYDDTWDRSGDVQRAIFQKKIMAELITRKIPYILLEGTLEQRVQKVKALLEKYRKFQNLGEFFQNSFIQSLQ